ncbi:aminopeptidase N-like isoform X3 [Anoplolepis gracilipes]|uniref:aminopeptidase N-like isoform X3 n=1 Tax=Anoplolepis gracilipes TaxID=354296 RepID=UPI003B9F4CB8
MTCACCLDYLSTTLYTTLWNFVATPYRDSCYRYLKIDMAFLRLSFYSGLIFITIITFSINENTGNSSITFNDYFGDIRPVRYDVKLIPYFNEDKEHEIYKYQDYKLHIEAYKKKGNIVFYGELSAIIDISRPITEIYLNSTALMILLSGALTNDSSMYTADLQNKTVHTNVKYLRAQNIKHKNEKQICILYFNETLSGRYRLITKFVTAINNTENIITSLKTIVARGESFEMPDVIHFQAIGARRLFPCWDKPTIQATFNIAIKHHHKYKVFSNMLPQKKETCKHEMHETETYMKWTCFNTTPPMSTYIVTVVISSADFFKFEIIGSRIITWRRPESDHIEFAETIATEAIIIFESEWKKLKVPKVQFIVIHSLLYDNEMWGLLLNSETDIIYDRNLDSVAHKIKVARLIGRKVAHQWFADVNPFWSFELWLIDGLTTMYGLYAINTIMDYENSEMLDLFVVQVYYESLRLETDNQSFIKEANFSENNAFSSFYGYVKAPLILRMLQNVITDNMFHRKVHEHLNIEFKSKNLLQNLWLTMQDILSKLYPQKKLMLPSTIVNDWMKSINYPVLKITRDISNKANVYNITIENYEVFKKYAFWIPVTYTSQYNPNFSKLRIPLYDKRLILLSSSQPNCQVSVKDNGWVILNLRQTGYYRVNYDPENWQKIAEYLNSIEYTKIHVLNRAKIIDDAFYFMINGQLNSFLFWNLTSYLGQETNYIAWYPMIKAFEHMSSIFPFPDKEVQNIKEKIKNILTNLLEKIKYEEEPKESDLTKCLRQEAIKWLCILDDPNCLIKAYDKLILHIVYMSDKNKVLPWWQEWLYCKGLMSAESHIWRMVKDNSREKYINNDRLLEFLACASNEIIEEYLESIMFKHNETYNEIQIKRNMISFFFIIAKHVKHNNVFLKILNDFDKLTPRGVNGLAIIIAIINHMYSEEQLIAILNLRNIMGNIIEIEAYKTNFMRIYKKNGTFPEMANIEASFYKYKNIMEEWMSGVHKKLQRRLSEIGEIKKYFKIYSFFP